MPIVYSLSAPLLRVGYPPREEAVPVLSIFLMHSPQQPQLVQLPDDDVGGLIGAVF